MAGKLYPQATHIVDIYHAREHLHRPGEPPRVHHPRPGAVARRPQRAELDAGEHRRRSSRPPAPYPLDGIKAIDLERKLGYFAQQRPPHALRRASSGLGMFIGSGAIEGGIKAIVVQRTKQSGMHWTVEGAADIIALRCQHASGRWNDFVAPRPRPSRRAPGSHLTDTATQTLRTTSRTKIIPNKAGVHPPRKTGTPGIVVGLWYGLVPCRSGTGTASTRRRVSSRPWRGRSAARGWCTTTACGVRDNCHAAGEKISDTEVQRRVITLAKRHPGTGVRWPRSSSVALVQACQDARRAYQNWFDSLSGKREGPKGQGTRGSGASTAASQSGSPATGSPCTVSGCTWPRWGTSRSNGRGTLPSASVVGHGDPRAGRPVLRLVRGRAREPRRCQPATVRWASISASASLVVTSDWRGHRRTRGSCGAKERRLARMQRALSRKRRGLGEPGQGPAPGARSCTARCGKPGSTTRTRQLCGWSATTKRSTPKTSPCPG